MIKRRVTAAIDPIAQGLGRVSPFAALTALYLATDYKLVLLKQVYANLRPLKLSKAIHLSGSVPRVPFLYYKRQDSCNNTKSATTRSWLVSKTKALGLLCRHMMTT